MYCEESQEEILYIVRIYENVLVEIAGCGARIFKNYVYTGVNEYECEAKKITCCILKTLPSVEKVSPNI